MYCVCIEYFVCIFASRSKIFISFHFMNQPQQVFGNCIGQAFFTFCTRIRPEHL